MSKFAFVYRCDTPGGEWLPEDEAIRVTWERNHAMYQWVGFPRSAITHCAYEDQNFNPKLYPDTMAAKKALATLHPRHWWS